MAVGFVVLFLAIAPLIFFTRSNEMDLDLLVLDFVEFVVEAFDVEFSFFVLKVVELSFLSEVVVSVRVVLEVSFETFDGLVWFLEERLLVLDLMVLVWFFEERLLFGLINLVWFLVLLDFFFKGCSYSSSCSASNNVLLLILDNCFLLS